MEWIFSSFLKENGMEPLSMDECIFNNKNGTLFLAVYIADELIVGENIEEVDSWITSKIIWNKEISRSSQFLGFQTEKIIEVNQDRYTESLLKKNRMEKAKPAETPDYEEKIVCSDVL